MARVLKNYIKNYQMFKSNKCQLILLFTTLRITGIVSIH